jgi:acetylglutamate kinase
VSGVKVVKIGGAALADPHWLGRLAGVVAQSPDPLVFVHGGGPEISALSERLAVPVQWVNGRRATPPEALDVAAMVLSGRINKRIVSALVAAGVDALGISGEDASLLLASPREGGALGRVGTVEIVRIELLASLLRIGLTPVVSPISRGTDGGALNVNADEVATAVAAQMRATELLFLTDVPGVHDGSSTIASLNVPDAIGLMESGIARGGMAVKVEAAIAALRAGVSCVRIGGLEMLIDNSAGTAVRDAVEVSA